MAGRPSPDQMLRSRRALDSAERQGAMDECMTALGLSPQVKRVGGGYKTVSPGPNELLRLAADEVLQLRLALEETRADAQRAQRELADQRSHDDVRQLAEECAQLQRKLNASEAVARDAIEQLHVSEERARVGSHQVAELTRQLAESEVARDDLAAELRTRGEQRAALQEARQEVEALRAQLAENEERRGRAQLGERSEMDLLKIKARGSRLQKGVSAPLDDPAFPARLGGSQGSARSHWRRSSWEGRGGIRIPPQAAPEAQGSHSPPLSRWRGSKRVCALAPRTRSRADPRPTTCHHSRGRAPCWGSRGGAAGEGGSRGRRAHRAARARGGGGGGGGRGRDGGGGNAAVRAPVRELRAGGARARRGGAARRGGGGGGGARGGAPL
eukprot:Transcript_4081.p1 GENE.Transcript_4081~~Transcript_4081.p1  ORF type:complete len:386 (+),score=62.03 Transcript_4081:106-1263(+)